MNLKSKTYGKKNCEIAKIMGRSPSTISREIKRNSETRERYSASKADEKAKVRTQKRFVGSIIKEETPY